VSATNFDSEIFRLVVAAAFYHPDPPTKDHLRGLLDTWLEGLAPCHSPDTVRTAIVAQKGTFLEPFHLSNEDLECSVFLVRAAFSGASKEQRIRIVSRDTIGTEGGLILTRNLKSYYVERFPEGKTAGQPKESCVFLPALVPPLGKTGALPTIAELISEDTGFRIRIKLPGEPDNAAALARGYQSHSRIEGVPEDFNRLGLRVEIQRDEVHILTGSPEAMIRMMAHMVGEATLTLESKDAKHHCALVRLSIPEDEPVRLKAVIGGKKGFAIWMAASPPAPIELEDSHKLAVCSWLPSPREWLELALENLP
jgi:hypothetical protein